MRFIKQWVVFITVGALSSGAALSWAEDASVAPNPSVQTQQPPQDLNLPFKGLNNYSQNFSDWGILLDPNYDQPIPIKNPQMQDTIHQHYYGKKSVWEVQTGTQLASQINDIRGVEKSYLEYSDGNGNHIDYYNNPDPSNPSTIIYDKQVSDDLKAQMDLDNQLPAGYQYDPARRGIMVQNANTRILPTTQGYYKKGTLVGEGPDFDNIQTTATWAGTPVYILAYTNDKKWDLVATGDCIGWVEDDKVATVTQNFIDAWKKPIEDNGLVAIINPEVAIAEKEGTKHFTGYVGMILPLADKDEAANPGFSVMIPVKDLSGIARIHYANLSKEDAVKVPYLPTPRHFVTIMQHQLGRHYAWGAGHPYGTDPEIFYNDTSSETKNLLTAFGIYVPRHSTFQVKESEVPGRAEDYTYDATGHHTTTEERIAHLQESGHPFMTILGGLGLYLGNYANLSDPTKTKVALMYQNPFGLRPSAASIAAGKDYDRRAVIEKAVILPILASYPEDPNLTSFISRDPFIVMYLDDVAKSASDTTESKDTANTPTAAPTTLMVLDGKELANDKMDIKSLTAKQ